jgi:hypothetical protein
MADWRSELANFFNKTESEARKKEEELTKIKIETTKFYSDEVIPAFEELKAELESHGREIEISKGLESARIIVKYRNRTELAYEVKVRIHPNRAFPYPDTVFTGKDEKQYRSEGFIRQGSQDYTIDDIGKEEIIMNFLSEYKNHISFI